MNTSKLTFYPSSPGKKLPESPFLIAYRGISMNPTLREPEMLEVVPYRDRPIHAGDVVFFEHPQANHMVVHRVARMAGGGIYTRADNYSREDAFLLRPTDIKGRVVAAWSGRKKRNIPGGWRGVVKSCWLIWLRRFGSELFIFPRFFYRAMAHCGIMVRFLPARFRPRVVLFQAGGKENPWLLLGRRPIGRYDEGLQQWQIQRPFLLFVDKQILEKKHGKEVSQFKKETSRSSICEDPR
jgi:hypothetical protein